MISRPAAGDTRPASIFASPPTTLARSIHNAFRARVLEPHFSCLGARSAVSGERYRFGLYGALGEEEGTHRLARDLARFAARRQSADTGHFSTFVAAFTGPLLIREARFETLLWKQLQALHEIDARHHAWDASVSGDPGDPMFALSVGGKAFFVVGLHGRASRLTRRFEWPTLVFNPHDQFRRLRATGHFERMQEMIRQREVALQGSINPMLSDFGTRSEARQYAGRAVDEEWRCPFTKGEDG
ncbi:MAG: YqcI/YcgG family protein [Chloroflexota bacterium]|nr:YqcI/YcgG family protein [Chloroflexota bacterium]